MLLTDARNAVWDAIDNWSPLQTGGAAYIRKKFKFNDESSMLADVTPAGSDLNALAIFPSSTVPENFTAQFKKYPYALDFIFWTRDWIVPNAELLWEHIVDALYQSKADGAAMAYIHAETCRRPSIGSFGMDRVKLGSDQKTRAIKTRMQVVLNLTFSPYT